jgi:hypothetical protein
LFERPVQVAPRPAQPFSDLGQWMLKVWLAPRIGARWIEAPRDPVGRVRDLARAARVSEPSASRFVKQLESRGFVEREGRRLRLIRLEALLQAWSATRLEPPDLRVRFDLPVADPLEGLRSACALLPADHSPRFAVGLFAAARLHGVGHVRGAPVHLLHEDPEPAMLEALGLAPVGEAEAYDLLVRRPADPDCAFRGLVDRDGLPVADGLECWLDLVHHPARGEEQAAELLRAMDLPGEDPR